MINFEFEEEDREREEETETYSEVESDWVQHVAGLDMLNCLTAEAIPEGKACDMPSREV